MDPAIKTYSDKITSMMEANMTAVTAVTTCLDDLAAWRPDLERCIADLGDVVAALQQGRPDTNDTNGRGTQVLAPTVPPPATRSTSPRAAEGAANAPRGSNDHDSFHLQWGTMVVSFQMPDMSPTYL